MCLRRKQHAIVLFMVFHVSLCANTAVTYSASSKERNNILPLLPCATLLWVIDVFYLPPHSTTAISKLDPILCRLGRQADNNWLKVTSSGLRVRLGLHLPPECLSFFAFIVGEQLLCTWTLWVAPMLGILAARLPRLWIPEWINS